METVFAEEIGQHLAVYIDDLNIYSTEFEQHIQHLEGILKEKCQFACEELEFLGHVFGRIASHLTIEKHKQ